MAYYGYRARTTYAPGHRPAARSKNGIYFTQAGEGILSQTCDGRAQGFTRPIETGRRKDGAPLYFVESEQFAGRYYALYQTGNDTWFFSGGSGLAGDAKRKALYVGKVEAFLATQSSGEVA